MPKNTAAAAQEEYDETEGAMFENAGDGLVINLEEVEAQSFELLPAGWYNVMFDDNEFQMSKSSGKPMWNARLTVIDEGQYQNRKIFHIFSFSEGALPGTKAAFAAIKPDLISAGLRVQDPDVVSSLIGLKCKVKVKIQKGQDGYEDKNQISKWAPVDEIHAFG